MRASEFVNRITEARRSKKTIRQGSIQQGDIPYNYSEATPGALKNVGYYGMYRASMAMAEMPHGEHEVTQASWMGPNGYVGTYTPEEEELAIEAFKRLGLKFDHYEKGPSREPEAVNKQSPIKPFNGYVK